MDLLRERDVVPSRPLGLAVFPEEEGFRFGVACLGSRLLTGVLPAHVPTAVLSTRNPTGISLSPEESVEDDDAERGSVAPAHTLRDLLTTPVPA